MNLINFDRLWAFFPLIFRSVADKCTCIWKTSNSFDQHFRSDLKCVYGDTVLNKALIDKWRIAPYSGSRCASEISCRLEPQPMVFVFVTIQCQVVTVCDPDFIYLVLFKDRV